VNKLQGENSRLKRSSASNAKYVELIKQVRELRTANERLKESTAEKIRRDTSTSEMSLKLARMKNISSNQKKLLRDKDKELTEAKGKLIKAQEECDRMASELDSRRKDLERKKSHLSADEQRIEYLQKTVNRLEEEAKSYSTKGSENAGIIESGLRKEVKQLRDENTKLLNELSAFDLEFFEEIEDLKYRYHQAVEELASLI